jgi:hypothetical protein
MTTSAEHLPTAGRVSLTSLRRPPARPVRPAVARLSREFRDMPRLLLTVDQAARLTGFDQATAEDALRALVASGILVEGPDGAFRRAEPSPRQS